MTTIEPTYAQCVSDATYAADLARAAAAGRREGEEDVLACLILILMHPDNGIDPVAKVQIKVLTDAFVRNLIAEREVSQT